MADRADAVRELATMKARHAGSHGGGRLRAAIFGINDGLVTNARLVVGVADADTTRRAIILAGVAGLVAGAFSRAAGDYISGASYLPWPASAISLYMRRTGSWRDSLAASGATSATPCANSRRCCVDSPAMAHRSRQKGPDDE